MPEISLVVPVYNEEGSLPAFMESLRAALAQVTEDYEVIFALDPSRDHTEEMIVEFHGADPRIKLLRFSRRFGQPAATWAGLAYSAGSAVIVMDCDMQDPPELIPEMYRLWREEGFKVVIPQRRSRAGENIGKRAISWWGYWFINKIAAVDIPKNAGDFRLLDRCVVDELMRLSEGNAFLRGLTAVVGFKTRLLPFDRQARHGGETKYHLLTGNLTHAFNGVVGFSGIPLRILTMAGFLMAALALAAIAAIVVGKVYNFYDFAVGLPSLGCLLLFLSGCQFVGIGVLGAYIGRIYEETLRRPMFIVEQSVGFDRQTQAPACQRDIP